MASPDLQVVLQLIAERPRPLVNPTRQQIRDAMEDRSFPATEDDPQESDTSTLEDLAGQYLDGADTCHPLASPLYTDYAALPPLLLQVGGAEMLLSDTTIAAARARSAGVDILEEIWDEMFDVWRQYTPMLPEGQQAIKQIGEWIRQQAVVPA